MRSDSVWEVARSLPKGKGRSDSFRAVIELYDFKKSRFDRDAVRHRRLGKFGNRVASAEAQAIAGRVFNALAQYVFGKRGRPRFKGVNRPLKSLEGKSNVTGIRWMPGSKSVIWNGLRLVPILPKRDSYLEACLQLETAYCRICWRLVNGNRRWYLQLVQKGVPPQKRVIRDGVVGLDYGPSQIAVVSEKAVGLENFAGGVVSPWEEVRRLQRGQDRSRRVSNPVNFDEKGRAIKGKQDWVESGVYLRRKAKIASLFSDMVGRRKAEHGNLVNRILACGTTVKTEEVSHLGFQKMFGRSVGARGPGMFMDKLSRKAERAGGKVEFLDTWALKLSQYNHVSGAFEKKPLSQRFHPLGNGLCVQRDVYSAFLALCVEGGTHNPSHIEKMWATADPLLRGAGLLVNQPAKGKPCFSTVALPPSERVALEARSIEG